MSHRTTLRGPDHRPAFDTAADALRAAGLDWGVELENLTTAAGRTAPARAVVRADTRDPLGVVGTQYKPCDNRTATGWIDRYAEHGVRVTGAEAFRGGERCVLYALVGDRPAEVRPGDFVALQLVVSWSHDGSSSTSASLRVLRLACSNGLVLASDAGRMFSLRHTKNADPGRDAIQAQVRAALGRFGESVATFRGLADRPAPNTAVRKYVEDVMEFEPDPETGDLPTRSKNVLDDILARHEAGAAAVGDLLAADRGNRAREESAAGSLMDSILANYEGGRGQEIGGGGTWWNAYNAVTEYLTHTRGRTADSRQESLLFGTSARINERALEAALSYSGVA